ncbi:hypothetical protein T439DRAFT_325498 [Meredithblackwellia eburnea MCA 4105]
MKYQLLFFAGAIAGVQAQSSASSTASGSTATSSSSSAASTQTTTSGVIPATATATQLLTVPTYSTASAFATPQASSLAIYLPGYTYNLTSESNTTRTGICNLTTQYCATSQCSSSTANVTTNFCNPTTMGWNCKCNQGATSRLQAEIVPVNSYDCRLRTSACLDQCQNPKASPPVTNIQSCQQACNYIIGSTCGTASQYIPEYEVNSYNDKPKYYPDTSKGGVAPGITTKSAAGSLRVPFAAVVGSVVLGGLLLIR